MPSTDLFTRIGFLLLSVSVLFSTKPLPAVAGTPRDQAPHTFTDPDFRFRVKKLESTQWKFTQPKSTSGDLRIRIRVAKAKMWQTRSYPRCFRRWWSQ